MGEYLNTPSGRLDLTTGELFERNLWPGQPMTAVTPEDPAGCPQFVEWVRCCITGRPEALRWFVAGALHGLGDDKQLLVRTQKPTDPGGNVSHENDLLALAPVFRATLGGYYGSLSAADWGMWPRDRARLWPELEGRRLVLLGPCERQARFPHGALGQLLMELLPVHFILPGALGRQQDRLERVVTEQLARLPAPTGEKAAPLMGFLVEEAPHILAWLLRRPTQAERQP